MKLEISGQDVLNLVSARLNHLLACREFLDEILKRHLDEKLVERQAKEDAGTYNQTTLKDKLAEYQKLRRDHAFAVEVSTRSPVRHWLDDVEELEAAEKLVKYEINRASGGPYGDGLPRELNSRLRDLTDFDDSE